MKSILKNIETIRKENHIKQEVIASELGIKQSSYSSFINRDSDITIGRLSRISNILGVSVVDIITFPEKYVPESSVHQCAECAEKDKTIQHLNKYIEVLENRKWLQVRFFPIFVADKGLQKWKKHTYY